MGWEPDLGKLFMSGLVLLLGIWAIPYIGYQFGGLIVSGALVYAITAATGVFIGNVPNLFAVKKVSKAINAGDKSESLSGLEKAIKGVK